MSKQISQRHSLPQVVTQQKTASNYMKQEARREISVQIQKCKLQE